VRTSAGIVIGLVALVAIVGTAMSSATVEQERLLSDFTAEAGRQVGASAAALSRLDSLHQDVRMLSDLVERSRRDAGSELRTERRVWESAFRALAVVVVHYRIIGLVDADGRIEVLAVDPTEPPATADVLLPQVRTLGAAVATAGAERLGAPAHLGDRSLLFYGDSKQLVAQLIETGVGLAWNVLVGGVAFWVIGKVLGSNRVPAAVEIAGLDVPEMGLPGYPEFVPQRAPEDVPPSEVAAAKSSVPALAVTSGT
jgi:hypothetical protein